MIYQIHRNYTLALVIRHPQEDKIDAKNHTELTDIPKAYVVTDTHGDIIAITQVSFCASVRLIQG